jgi:hypothetical protein
MPKVKPAGITCQSQKEAFPEVEQFLESEWINLSKEGVKQ